ncbi:AAA family ATPase [Bacillus thuringiensis]|uniref:AAA family ATPase n=1 Tax=Bacillus thuringiensis TaxID=1428 RepID=UPI001483B1A5|nr:AAA family ATPase [Bacillus thuringiensis]
MELAYIWIKDYREGLINEQGFNFDNQYRYQCKVRNENQYEIYVKENLNYIEDFFAMELESKELIANIRNVTAIVGQNGAGKSSILDFIKEQVREKEPTSDKRFRNKDKDNVEEYICIFRECIDEEKKYYISHSANFKVNIILEDNINFNFEYTSQEEFQENLTNTTLIYFSNVFDCKNEYSNGKLLNISTNYLTSNSYERNQNIEAEGTNYKFSEMQRQIQFVYGMKGKYNQVPVPFILPNQVDIFTTIGYFAPSIEDKSKLTGLYIDLYSQLENYKEFKNFKMFNIKERGGHRVRRFAELIIGHILFEIDRSELRHKFTDIRFDFNDNTLENGSRNSYFKLIRGILELATIISEKDKSLMAFSEMLKSLASLMIQYYKYDFNKLPPYRGRGRMRLELTYNTNGLEKERFEKLINTYEKACINHEFLQFSWRSMSSGEMALLNIYARFYFLLSLKDIQKNPENDLIILIDEGEVYMHPHWQSQIINSLIEYFSMIFKNNDELKQRNIQIILTSNSPFVVSDLPSTNIIFLKKEENKTVVVDGLEDYHQTFAANIHSLLSHSFFMEDGVTGAFAKKKINEIIDLLVNKDINTILQNEKKIEKTINLIGEPLVRNKLSQMLSDKLSIRMMSVEREIKDLKARLEELERWKGDTNKA